MRDRMRLVFMQREHKDPRALYLESPATFAERFGELLAGAKPADDMAAARAARRAHRAPRDAAATRFPRPGQPCQGPCHPASAIARP